MLRGAVNLTELLDDFFPNLEGDHPARALSRDFWATYAEPVSLFMLSVHALAVRLKLAMRLFGGASVRDYDRLCSTVPWSRTSCVWFLTGCLSPSVRSSRNRAWERDTVWDGRPPPF